MFVPQISRSCGGGRALAMARRSVNMVEPAPIHGPLILLVYRSRKSDAASVWSEWKPNSRCIFLGVRVKHVPGTCHQVPSLCMLVASITRNFLATINHFWHSDVRKKIREINSETTPSPTILPLLGHILSVPSRSVGWSCQVKSHYWDLFRVPLYRGP